MNELIVLAENQREGVIVKRVNTFTELRSYEPSLDKEVILVLGGDSLGDLKAGNFRYDSVSVLADDNQNTIVTSGGARWRRVNLGYASTTQGAKADSALQPGDNISSLTNDSDFATQSDLDNLTLEWQNDIAGSISGNLTQDVVAPTVNDDSTQGYSVNSRWYDTALDREYICLDATAGAAVWELSSPSSSPADASNLGVVRIPLDTEVAVALGGDTGASYTDQGVVSLLEMAQAIDAITDATSTSGRLRFGNVLVQWGKTATTSTDTTVTFPIAFGETPIVIPVGQDAGNSTLSNAGNIGSTLTTSSFNVRHGADADFILWVAFGTPA